MTIGSEVRTDVALLEPLRFITRQAVQKRGNAIDGQVWLLGKGSEGPLVGPHQRLQRWAIERNMDGVDKDAHGGDLEVIADPGQRSESFFLRDLFR